MFRSLFWKIFISIFLANLLAIIAAIYYFIPTQLQERFETVSRNVVETIVEQIESGQTVDLSQLNRRIPPRAFQSPPWRAPIVPLRHHIFLNNLRILDDQNQIIFGQLDPNNQHELIQFNYQSQSGHIYQIEAKLPIKQRALDDLLRHLHSIRFIVLFFSTLIVSLILSLLIVRPLKQLEKHVRSLASGDIHTRVEQNLLKRHDEIGDLSREFNEMARMLDQLIHSKQQLLHDVSHELRAPLARLQTIAALMQQQNDSNPATIERIERECTRMNSLIQEILDYARLQNDLEHNEAAESVNLFELFNHLIENTQQEFPQHPIRLVQTQTYLCIPGQINMLERAFENIVRNACIHTPQSTAIDISVQSTTQQIHITIRDHGPGMNNQDLTKLTTPFFRADNHQQSKGYGLGLNIAQRIIKHHQGVMTIQNHTEGGLQVAITFQVVDDN